MKRREFITLLGGGAAAAWPLAARAQQRPMPVVGYLHQGVPEESGSETAAFRKGLSGTGYDEGRSVTIEYRWAHNDVNRLPELAADLVRRRVAVIAAPVATQGARAAKTLTATIPIVFNGGFDPVEAGLVASLNRPGGNVTGISSMNQELGTKRLGLLHELLPQAKRIAALLNPTQPNIAFQASELETAAAAMGWPIEMVHASSNREIDAAFANLVQSRAEALVVAPNTLFRNRRQQLSTLAARHAIPAIYAFREHAEAGGLMSYGSSISDLFRQTGIYVGRVLKGERPADLPVMRATKFEFVINLQTARALNLTVPPTLLALADEVIE
jgi:ABC-type uncharacterized transport system substrate-binding protein